MMHKVTFSGIDERTDIGRLVQIAEKYPTVEFGLLLSPNHAQLGNRYLSPEALSAFLGKGLPLSLHVCGQLSWSMFAGNDWSRVRMLSGGDLSAFGRIQLNVANRNFRHYEWTLTPPEGVQELIIQQSKFGGRGVFTKYLRAKGGGRDFGRIVMLLDASGGRGLYMGAPEAVALPYVGYAGGIEATNVCEVVRQLNENPLIQDYWIDMESGVRDEDDWFSPDACEQVLTMLCQSGLLKVE